MKLKVCLLRTYVLPDVGVGAPASFLLSKTVCKKQSKKCHFFTPTWIELIRVLEHFSMVHFKYPDIKIVMLFIALTANFIDVQK